MRDIMEGLRAVTLLFAKRILVLFSLYHYCAKSIMVIPFLFATDYVGVDI